MKLLNESEIASLLKDQPAWALVDGMLTREWVFGDFVEAMLFVNRVAGMAEDAGHHPDIEIRYNKVRLTLVSHDAGGLTDRDLSLASRLNETVSLRWPGSPDRYIA
ncbi:4a-hydroxytetrahydrobiopterin dehydratase [Granulicella arctica]|uniref:4a-hydroxytetrahydrobiopterin dehydratase n=1 Tax=Granulicella arctica TaxID=940613 RepID=UPI0021E0DAF3|nr:4a-hydroxytetrahydrobiopterin dehydratase [Granulicella arctica]